MKSGLGFGIGIGGMLLALGIGAPAPAQHIPGERPALGTRITQQMVEHQLTHYQLRREGMRIFSTPFNRLDGLGDGPMDPSNPIDPGGRPTLGDNGIFLRMNGLDAQSCLECHSVLSHASVPARFAVGGVGGVAASAFPEVIDPDVADQQGNGFAAITGRMINPPFNFGAGGVEILAKEMTARLQRKMAWARANPNQWVDLVTHGVDFGAIRFDGADFDVSQIEGIDDDLVVRPFGRKGCCHSVREFDRMAMPFHHGIQPVEDVGDRDDDGDGVTHELLVGELSALHVFQVSLERPGSKPWLTAQEQAGRRFFHEIGCADCHRPSLRSESRYLPLSFPEVETDPTANVYMYVDLSGYPTSFQRVGSGVDVPLFADLKRHDMGPRLAETTGGELDRFFHTARLWGVADTAPYLHDGRAPTLTAAIRWHGGEARQARDGFVALSAREKTALLAFLRTLRTPVNPNADLIDQSPWAH